MLLLGNESMPNKALEDLPLGGIIAFHLLWNIKMINF
jgi:hypothetical protein